MLVVHTPFSKDSVSILENREGGGMSLFFQTKEDWSIIIVNFSRGGEGCFSRWSGMIFIFGMDS